MTEEQKQALIEVQRYSVCEGWIVADEVGRFVTYEAFLALAQRAEAAEAKLAELEQQEPVAYVHPAYLQAGALGFDASVGRLAPAQIPLFTRPATAADLAELVPTKGCLENTSNKSLLDWQDGWDACIDTILRNIEEAK